MKNNTQDSFARQYFQHIYWILASVVICVVVAFFYLNNTTTQYRVNAQLHISQQSSISPIELNNALESLKSNNILRSTVEQLSLQIAYLQHDNGKMSGLYGKDVSVEILADIQSNNISNGTLKISSADDGYLQIDGGGEIKLIRLDSVFNEPFGKFRAVKGPSFDLNKNTLIVKINSSERIAEQYRQNLVITTGQPDSKIINLSLLDINPARGKDFLQQLIKNYNSTFAHAENSSPFPDPRIKDSLSIVQNELTNLKARIALLKLQNERPKEIPKVKPVKKALSFNDQQQLNIYDVIEPYLKVSINQFDLVPYSEEIQDLSIRKSVDQYNKGQAEKQTKLKTLKENDPEINVINNQLSSFQKNIIAAIEERKSQIKGGLVSAEPPILTINKSGKQDSIAQLENLIQGETKILGLLTAKLSKATSISDNTGWLLIAKKPTSSDEPEYPQYWLTYFFAFIIGLIPPLIIPYAKSNFKITSKEKVDRSDNIKMYSGIPIFITIPPLASGVSNQKDVKKASQVILVTAGTNINDKSDFIDDLAGTLSAESKRTVILDLNLREPVSFESFEMGNKVGITNFLKKEITEVGKLLILSKSSNNIYLIPAGISTAKSDDPVSTFFNSNDLVSPWGDENQLDKLVNDPAIGILIKKLRQDFDYIILNAPAIIYPADLFPITSFSDSQIIITTPTSRNRQLKSIEEFVRQKRFNNPMLYFFEKDASYS